MILTAIDAGFLTTTDASITKCSLRVLLPNAPARYCSTFDLTKPADRKMIQEKLWPVIVANRDAILAAPEDLENIIRSHAERLRKEAEAERQAQKVETAKASMKSGEAEVILFGKRFWPIIDPSHPELVYDYERLRRAAWTFRELHTVMRLSPDPAPKSCALRLRHAIKFLNGYMDAQVMRLLVDMSRALEQNPQGEERLPEMPNLDRPYEAHE
jgi:hypothetical protein